MLADTSQGNWYSDPHPRKQAKARLWGASATCQAPAPFLLPSSCCRMAAQHSLPAGIFQPQNLLQHLPLRHATRWAGVQSLPSAVNRRRAQGVAGGGAAAGRALSATEPAEPHTSPLEACAGGANTTHQFIFSSLHCSASPVSFLIICSSEKSAFTKSANLPLPRAPSSRTG